MTTVRAALAVALLLALGAAAAADAQPTEKVYRVGYLASASRLNSPAVLAAFREGMRELGYVEGRNLLVEARYADDKFERLPGLAQELLRLNPDVLFVSTTPASLAAKAATSTVPIVFVSSSIGRRRRSFTRFSTARSPATSRSSSRRSSSSSSMRGPPGSSASRFPRRCSCAPITSSTSH